MNPPVKRKRQHTLPNRQLARVFRFSASDLAANRAGFITRAQEWGFPLWVRWLGDLPVLSRLAHSRRRQVMSLCGRAKLSYKQFQITSMFYADMIEAHSLSIEHQNFRLTARQYQAIGEGLLYRVYYVPETNAILSLERAINGCNETRV